MEIATKEKPWVVDLLEFESGWGSRIDDRKVFATYDEGKKYAENFNSSNTAKEVPDWYMVATEPYRSRNV